MFNIVSYYDFHSIKINKYIRVTTSIAGIFLLYLNLDYAIFSGKYFGLGKLDAKFHNMLITIKDHIWSESWEHTLKLKLN